MLKLILVNQVIILDTFKLDENEAYLKIYI